MPVAKKINSKASAIIPTVISFIFTPPDSYDIEDEYEALNEAADTHEVRDGEEGELECRRNFARGMELTSD
jgi:hypothetical protein